MGLINAMPKFNDDQKHFLQSAGLWDKITEQAGYPVNNPHLEPAYKERLQAYADGGLISNAANGQPRQDKTEIELICNLGFGYLFTDDYSEAGVNNVMMAEDGVVRYSRNFSEKFNKTLATVIFRAAQVVYKSRFYNEMPETTTVLGKRVVSADVVSMGLDLPYEAIQGALDELAGMGVLIRFDETIGNKANATYYAFAKEGVVFPPFGQSCIR